MATQSSNLDDHDKDEDEDEGDDLEENIGSWSKFDKTIRMSTKMRSH